MRKIEIDGECHVAFTKEEYDFLLSEIEDLKSRALDIAGGITDVSN